MDRQMVKIKVVDFGTKSDNEFYEKYFISLIEKFAEVVIDDRPDYVFCGEFRQAVFNYNCTRIAYFSEENEPDFNLYDYAIGYNELSFYDRYLCLPYYARFTHQRRVEACLTKHLKEDQYYLSKTKFCNFVYSNGFADKFRENCFKVLNDYKHVDSAGRFLNNMPEGKRAGDKCEFIKNYRFTIAFGNAQKPGYADEKIYDAWEAGTIPIFWGDSTFAETFNPKAYIDCTKCKSGEEIVAKVKEIEESTENYLAMQKEPIVLPSSKFYEYRKTDKACEFLKNIVSQGPENSKRLSDGIARRNYEKEQKLLMKIKKSLLYKLYNKCMFTLIRRDII